MPRTRKTISIDDKINEQKQVVSKAKVKYESELAILNDLMKKRDEINNCWKRLHPATVLLMTS